jgi:hypothetical protein
MRFSRFHSVSPWRITMRVVSFMLELRGWWLVVGS